MDEGKRKGREVRSDEAYRAIKRLKREIMDLLDDVEQEAYNAGWSEGYDDANHDRERQNSA